MLLKGNFLPKMHTDENILRRNYLSYIFEFQLVPFAFSPILEDPFKLPPLPYSMGRGDFFPNPFHGGTNVVGKIYRGIFYLGGLMSGSYQERRSFTKCLFQ